MSSHKRGGEPRNTQFGRWIIEVLRHLHDPVFLHSHPLSRCVATDDPRASGEVLREDVTNAICELCQISAGNQSAARGYDVLQRYYVLGQSRVEVRNQLQISHTEFHRALAKGQEALISLLAWRWGAAVFDGQSSESGIAVGALIPTPFDSFIGRTNELDEVERLLLRDPAVRLVTIHGPPGAGKTRLAIEVARRIKEAFEGGVFYVPLATITASEQIPDAILADLGLSESGNTTAQQCLENFFRTRDALLVLDNLEHLPGAARFIGSLLSASSRLKLLATSRSVLRLTGENCYPLSPLAVPRGDISQKPDEQILRMVRNVEAVQLFVDRARAADPKFTLTARNVRAVCKICREVDGLPLGIELVAARTRFLSPHAILERLKSRLDLASGRDADRPSRQQNLRTAISWSYDLLGEEERQLFRLLGIFEGPSSLEAIEAVSESPNLLDTLDELVAHSLVRRRDDDEGMPYFDMLATIQELAVDELKASGEWEAAAERHISFYRSLAEDSVIALRGPHQIVWASRMAIESPNLTRAVLRLMDREPSQVSGFVAPLGSYWHYRSQVLVGREWSERALKITDADPLATARVRMNAAIFARDQGDVDVAQRYLETSLRDFQTLGDNISAGFCLNFIGLIARQKGDYSLALRRFSAGRAIYERAGNQWGLGWTYYVMGTLFEQQRRLPRARALYERAHSILRDIGDLRGLAAALSGLGNVQRLLGEFDESRLRLEEALRLQRRIGNRSGAELTLLNLSGVAHHAKDFETAHRLIDEAVDTATKIGDRRGLRIAHAHRVVVLKSEGRFAEALQLAEEALAMCREQGDVPWVAILLATIGDLEERAIDRDGADSFRQSLQMFSFLHDSWAAARTVALIGLSAARRERFREALIAFTAAEAIQPGIRSTIDYSNAAEWATLEAQARDRLGPVDATVALEEAKSVGRGRALAVVRELLERFTLPSPASGRGTPCSAETRLG